MILPSCYAKYEFSLTVIFFSKAALPFTTKPGTKHTWKKGFNIYVNEEQFHFSKCSRWVIKIKKTKRLPIILQIRP